MHKVKKWVSYVTGKAKERTFLTRILKDNRHYLKSGTYGFTFTEKRKIYLEDKQAKEFLLNNKEQANQSAIGQLKYGIDAVTSKLFKAEIVNEENHGIKGELLMVTYTQNVKIFDFANGIILNKFTEDFSAYQNIKQAHQCLKDYLNLTMIEFWEEEHAYLEKYLAFVPYRQWSKEVRDNCIAEIFKSYERYFSSLSEESIKREDALVLLKAAKATPYGTHKVFTKLERILQETGEETMFPVVRAHGDMKFENILMSRETFYFIDLEFSSDFFFFYDVMNLLFIEALKGDSACLASYLGGENDEWCQRLFAAFNLTFRSDHRLLYLAVYLIDRFYHFDLKLMEGRLDLDDVLEQYDVLLTKSIALKDTR